MRYDLNLASRPFVNTSMPAAAAILAALLIAAFGFVNMTVLTAAPSSTDDEGEGADYEMRIDAALDNLERMEAEIEGAESLLRSDEARLLSARISFSNGLIARQKLNWTRLFNRLEALTPHTVRMLRISPVIQEGELMVVLRVEESEPEAALGFVRALESSPYFGEVRLEDESPSRGETGQVWRLRVSYLNR